jgi:hypothetical protein
MPGPACHHALAILPAKDERTFNQSRDHRNARGLLQNIQRDAPVSGRHNLFHYSFGAVDPVLQVLFGTRAERWSGKQETKADR